MKMIYQFKITLKETNPPVWRRIQVPSTYTFWDLHVAIQDAMGWQDHHLHEFRIESKTGESLVFGIPVKADDSDMLNDNTLKSWKHKIAKYAIFLPQSFTYTYDFGDYWKHKVDFEEVALADPEAAYPACIKGKRACPPENCGGAWRYQEILTILAEPAYKDHKEMKAWVESQKGGLVPFDPEHFDPAEVVFSDPALRLDECEMVRQ